MNTHNFHTKEFIEIVNFNVVKDYDNHRENRTQDDILLRETARDGTKQKFKENGQYVLNENHKSI